MAAAGVPKRRVGALVATGAEHDAATERVAVVGAERAGRDATTSGASTSPPPFRRDGEHGGDLRTDAA
jgi:hypothetical protein